jgi:hypothetical protein
VFRPSGYPVQADPSGAYGFLNSTRTPQDMVFAPGHFYPQVCRDSAISASIYPRSDSPIIKLTPGGGFFLEFWMNFGFIVTAFADPTFQGGESAFNVVQTDGSFGLVREFGLQLTQDFTGFATLAAWLASFKWAFVGADGTNHDFTPPQDWAQVSIQVTFGGTIAAMTQRNQVRLNGALVLDWTDNVGSTTAGATADTFSTESVTCPIESLQLSAELNGAPTVFTPNARLDGSLNALVAVPALTTAAGNDPSQAADPWQVLQQMVDAELGYFGFDEVATPEFKNRKTINTGQAVRTVTTAESIQQIQSRCASASIANWLRQNVSIATRSAYQAVWSWTADAAGLPFVPAGATVFSNITFNQPVIGLSTLIQQPLANGGVTPTNPFSGFRANRQPDGKGSTVTNLTAVLFQTSPTTATIQLQNPNPFPVYLVTPSGFSDAAVGTPCLQIGGEYLTITTQGNAGANTSAPSSNQYVEAQWPPLQEGGAAANPRGPRFLQLPDTPWTQDIDSAQSLVDDQLAETYKTRPLFQGVTIVADPSLQLLDVLQLQDTQGATLNEPAVVVGLHLTLSKTAFTQSLDLRAVGTPGAWLMGVPGRSEMGVATYV